MERVGEDVAKFNIVWKSYPKVLSESTSKLLVTGQFADVTLVCEGQRIKCHRLILATYSSHLAQLLENLATSDAVICLSNGIKFNHLQPLVTFMYNGGVEVAQEDLPGVLKAAEELKVKGLSISDRPDPPVEEMVTDEDDGGDGGQVTDGTNLTDVKLRSITPEVPVVASTNGDSSLAVPVVVPLNESHDSQVAIPNQIGDCGRNPEEMADEETSTQNDDDAGSLGLGNRDGTHPIPKQALKQHHLATKTIAKDPHLRKPAILSSFLSGMTNAQIGGSAVAPPSPPHVRTGEKKSKRPRARKAGVPPQPSPFGENMKNAIEMVKSGWGLSRASREFKIPISTLSKYYKDPERLKTSKMYYFN